MSLAFIATVAVPIILIVVVIVVGAAAALLDEDYKGLLTVVIGLLLVVGLLGHHQLFLVLHHAPSGLIPGLGAIDSPRLWPLRTWSHIPVALDLRHRALC